MLCRERCRDLSAVYSWLIARGIAHHGGNPAPPSPTHVTEADGQENEQCHCTGIINTDFSCVYQIVHTCSTHCGNSHPHMVINPGADVRARTTEFIDGHALFEQEFLHRDITLDIRPSDRQTREKYQC